MKKSQLFPTKYLSAGDLDGDTHVKITNAILESLQAPDSKIEDKCILYFDQLQKGLPLNVTNWNSIEALHGDDSDDWIGKWVTLYPTKVQFGNKMVDGIRVRDEVPALPATVGSEDDIIQSRRDQW